MKTYLLKDVSTEEVAHRIVLRTDATTEEIQDYINGAKEFFYENEENGWIKWYGSYLCEGEFVIGKLMTRFNGYEIDIDENDVLYYQKGKIK